MHMVLKSDFKMAEASARCIPHLLLEDDCGHNQASYNCKLSNVLSNSNDVRRWVRPIAVKMSAQKIISFSCYIKSLRLSGTTLVLYGKVKFDS